MPKKQQLKARRVWMIAGVTVRVLLLIALGWLIKQKQIPYLRYLEKALILPPW